MKILWENADWPGSRIEPAITDLAWIANGDGHGMLGVGSDSGTVGITATDLHPTEDDHTRYNFNLRGHHSGICMVTWNKVQNKLASCDASGMIYVWVRNEDRWSVELVNDRGVKVRDLCWSPCGSSALICYEDNFVLIGSASGQRVWSNSFNTATTVTCGVWAPDSHHLVIGFAAGNIQVLSDQGANITERSFTSEHLSQLAFSPETNEKWTLAMLTQTNKVLMISCYDQIDPYVYESSANIIKMRWNSDGSALALINSNRELVVLDKEARSIHREVLLQLPADKELSALTWAFGNSTIIVAAGGHLAVGKILQEVPSLFNLVRYDVWKQLGCSSHNVEKLPLPAKEKVNIRALDHHIIRCRIPRLDDLCGFVCSVSEARCYCTIRPLARGSHSYVLCMEHLGGLVPLLIGRQVNRFLPQFHISLHPASSAVAQPPAGSSAQVEDVSIIPRASTGRNSLWRRSKRQIRALMSRHVRPSRPDTRLLQVSSNVWCTRFNITSMNANRLPPFLGQVVYKTSVLHLQPRQMTIDLALLSNVPPKETESRRPSVCPSPSSSEETFDEMSHLLGKTKEDGLTKEERAFFDKVVSECTSLRAAMTSAAVDTVSPGLGTSQVSALKESPARVESRQGEADLSMSTTSSWQDEIESLEFIDVDDRDFLMPSTSRDVAAESNEQWSSSSSRPQAPIARNDIQMDLDRLVRIAGQLSHRYDFNKKDRASISKMRSQMKELLKRVNEIEKKVGTDDVRAEVRQLMRTLKEIKNALGEGRPPVPAYNRLLTMHNKTPFWNETNQVYQLDFGGRVTQESAKNFQVELDNKQVLQFGRIDGGAYTLDFRSPFSASQAFAVALASITQRLK